MPFVAGIDFSLFYDSVLDFTANSDAYEVPEQTYVDGNHYYMFLSSTDQDAPVAPTATTVGMTWEEVDSEIYDGIVTAQKTTGIWLHAHPGGDVTDVTAINYTAEQERCIIKIIEITKDCELAQDAVTGQITTAALSISLGVDVDTDELVLSGFSCADKLSWIPGQSALSPVANVNAFVQYGSTSNSVSVTQSGASKPKVGIAFVLREVVAPSGDDTRLYTLKLTNQASNTPVITAGSFALGELYEIDTPGDTVWTDIGSADGSIGTQFIATGVGAGTGTAKKISSPHTSIAGFDAGMTAELWPDGTVGSAIAATAIEPLSNGSDWLLQYNITFSEAPANGTAKLHVAFSTADGSDMVSEDGIALGDVEFTSTVDMVCA